MKHVDEIVIDIETIPSQEKWVQDYVRENLSPPANYKDPEKIEKWKEENLEKQLDKCGLDGAFNHIVCIGYAINDEPAKVLHIENHKHEAAMIDNFFQITGKLTGVPTVIGHNVKGFDMLIIKQRAMIHQVPLCTTLPFYAKRYDDNPFDTMLRWNDNKPNDFVKLDKLCRAFGLPSKDGIDGSMVYSLWKAKNFRDLVEYCRDDVEITRNLGRRMRGLPLPKKSKKAA